MLLIISKRLLTRLKPSAPPPQVRVFDRDCCRRTFSNAPLPLVPSTDELSRKQFNDARNRHLWKMVSQLLQHKVAYVVNLGDPLPSNDTEELNADRRLQIYFRYVSMCSGEPVDELLMFERNYEDALSNTLLRIDLKLKSLKKKSLKAKRKQALAVIADTAEPSPSCVLNAVGEPLDGAVSNFSAFCYVGRHLVINQEHYAIVSPALAISKVEVDLLPLVGYPVYASVDVVGGTPSAFQYFWLRRSNSCDRIESKTGFSDEQPNPVCRHDADGALILDEVNGWILKSTDRTFVPDQSDIGHPICCIVAAQDAATKMYGVPKVWLPRLDNASSAMYNRGYVVDPPPSDQMLFAERHKLCAQWAAQNQIRCVSYNILADLYMNLNKPDDELYFPYCPKRFQSPMYRYPILLREIEGYHADLYCLQEVDTRNYDRYLEPHMTSRGWKAICKRKGGLVNEGSAMFYRPEKLELVQTYDQVLSNFVTDESNEISLFADLSEALRRHRPSYDYFLTRPAAVQVAVFRCLFKPNAFLCVATTHLHFKPHDSRIRLLQAAFAYRHLMSVVNVLEETNSDCEVGTVFCGDFNSTPKSAVYQMFETANVAHDHPDWEPADENGEIRSEISVGGQQLTFARRLRSVCPSLEYTTITHRFRGALDHIFVSDQLNVARVVPLPDERMVTRYTGLPSPVCPSDHLPVICELEFR